MTDGELRGFGRPDGRWGARNHILVLPSVVCADLVAERVAEGAPGAAVAVVHQHGCGQVGDDVEHTERAFLGFATNPNVGGVVVVSLGCETIQGRRLANRIAARGQRLEFVGIQASGGTVNTVERGREALARLQATLKDDAPHPAPAAGLVLGIESGPSPEARPAADALARRALAAGARVVLAVRGGGAEWTDGLWRDAPRIAYAAPAPPSGAAVMLEAGDGAEQHVGLAGAGAQVLVSLRGHGQAPIGHAICPVVAVGCDPAMYAALVDDFDLEGSADTDVLADQIWTRVRAAFSGQATASEQRGARDFSLRRVARTM
jgi:altronate dehydratase large subunit